MKKRIYILLAVVVSFLCISFASAATVPWDRTKVGTQVPLYGDGILVTASSTFLGNITAASLPTGCLTSVAGLFTSVGCSTIGSAFPFTPTTNYNVAVNSTSTPIWFTAGLMASSTSYFPNGIWNSSGSVGIGTTTPDIAGTTLDTLVIGTASAINAGIVLDLGAAGTGAYGFAIDGTINSRISYSAASKAMSFFANSLTAQMTLVSSGNVGIGTTDPINKLTISATTSTDITNGQQINLRSLRTTINTTNRLIGGITFTSNDTNLTAPGLVVSGVTSLANETHTGATQGTDLVFTTTGTGGTATNTEKVRITGDGNVGIGITAPENTLQISTTSAGIVTNGLLLQNRSSTVGTGVSLNFISSGTSFSDNRYNSITSINTDGSNGQALTFSTANSAAPAERLRITAAGNVGIGTTSPGQKLSVAGDILGNNIIGSYFTSTSTTASMFAGAITSTATAANTFPYASTTAISASGQFFGNTSDAVSTPAYSWGGDTTTGIYNSAASQVGIAGAGLQMANFKAGTTTLNIYATNGTLGEIRLGRTDNANRYNTIKSMVGTSATDNFIDFNLHNLTVASDYTSVNSILMLRGDGRVGISSSTPLAKLSVHANANDGAISRNLFTIASSTATATTTLFNIDNIGNTVVSAIMTAARVVISGIAAAFTPSVEGEIGIDTTSNQFKFFSGGAVRVIAPDVDQAFLFASSTLGAGTTTLKVSGYYRGSTFARFGCTSSGGGTFVAQLGDSTSSSTAVVSGTNNTTTFTALSLNNTFTSGEAVYYAIGSVSGTVTNPSCSFNRTITAD